MGDTCDECQFYRMTDGLCSKHRVYRRSCGEDACGDFQLADDIKEMGDYFND
jgi:hypothetical protein